MTHIDLVQKARQWLTRKCAVVITEMSTKAREEPDAIGWVGNRSVLIECKVSRQDFKQDQMKIHRQSPATGIGNYRYYMAPTDLLKVDELPHGWGLIEVNTRGWTKVVRKSDVFPVRSLRKEVQILLSTIRRIGQQAPVGIAIRCYTHDNQRRATLSVGQEKIGEAHV